MLNVTFFQNSLCIFLDVYLHFWIECVCLYKHLSRREPFARARARIGIAYSSHGKKIDKMVSVA